MTLGELTQGIGLNAPLPAEWAALSVSGVEYDSRHVQPGVVFCAFAGAKADGNAFAQQAMNQGAMAIVSELPAPNEFTGRWIQVEHGRRAMSLMSRRVYGAPDEALALIGVTGTNGKTTTAFCIDSMLRHAGRVTGMVGTIVYRIAGREQNAVNTTPDSLDLMRLMGEVRDAGGQNFTLVPMHYDLVKRRA